MATAGNTTNSAEEGKPCMNINLKDCQNIQVGENNVMTLGGESNTIQNLKGTGSHCTSNNTRSPTHNPKSETNQTHLSSTESLNETRLKKMTLNEETPIVRTELEIPDSGDNAALSTDNTSSDFRASFQQGEPLRKVVDNSFPCLEGKLIYVQEKLLERICCIKVTVNGKESHGTGFRVGSKYFMTAFHVMENVLIQFWVEVYKRLTEEERRQMEWTEDKIPVDGAWKLTKLLPFVDLNKRNELLEIGIQSITNHVQIKFGFVRENVHSSLANCSYDVAFVSPSHDVVILELIEDTNLPSPFHLKTINAAATKLHLIGHPDGGKLEHDPACNIIKDQEELENLVKEGISFFTTRGYREDQVKKDYEPCVLSSDRLLFHCSKSITHGASGSPLIVIINEEKAQVIGMLLRGHPKFYYNYDKRNGDRPDLLVESGISMEKVRSLLIRHSLHELAQNLFPEEF